MCLFGGAFFSALEIVTAVFVTFKLLFHNVFSLFRSLSPLAPPRDCTFGVCVYLLYKSIPLPLFSINAKCFVVALLCFLSPRERIIKIMAFVCHESSNDVDDENGLGAPFVYGTRGGGRCGQSGARINPLCTARMHGNIDGVRTISMRIDFASSATWK